MLKKNIVNVGGQSVSVKMIINTKISHESKVCEEGEESAKTKLVQGRGKSCIHGEDKIHQKFNVPSMLLMQTHHKIHFWTFFIFIGCKID